MRVLTKFLKTVTNKLSHFVKSTIKVLGRLIGVKEAEDNDYEFSQLYTAVWIFTVGIPIGLFTIGINFSIFIWAGVIFGLLAIVNLDEALMLTSLYTENN